MKANIDFWNRTKFPKFLIFESKFPFNFSRTEERILKKSSEAATGGVL